MPDNTAFPHRRVNVVGTSCSGKTTFAAALAAGLGVPHVELDALHWGANWASATPAQMRDRVARAAAADAWVIDGNYSVSREILWSRTQVVVWLDYSLPTILARYARRTAHRLRTGQEIWPGTGNRERAATLLTRDGLLWWILSTYRRRRRDYPRLLAQHPEIVAIRLSSPAAARAWLAAIAPANP